MIHKEDAIALFNELSNLLREHKFEWVVDQVAEEIALGKLESKRVTVSDVPRIDGYLLPDLQLPKAPAKSEVFTQSVPFSDVERLALLVRGLRRATTDVADVYSAATELISRPSASGHVREYFEYRSEDNSDIRVFTANEGGKAKEAMLKLRTLLDELQAELE